MLLAGAPWWRSWPGRRGETVDGRGADAGGWGLPGRDAMLADYDKVHQLLGGGGASGRIAEAMIEELK